MSTLIKREHGILYEDTFEENSLIWSLSPSNVDCLRFEPDGLRILHNDKYITYTMKEPEGNYCLSMQLDHEPISSEDIGGIIVLSDTNEYAECQTYLSNGPSEIANYGENINAGMDLDNRYVRYSFTDEEDTETEEGESGDSGSSLIQEDEEYVDTIYQFLKVIKYDKTYSHLYQFYASADGIKWIEVGTASFAKRSSIGFFLYSTKDRRLLEDGNFTINNFYLYKSSIIVIEGINILQDFEIISEDHKIILRSDSTEPGQYFINRSGNRIEINTSNILVPFSNATLRVYPKLQYDITVAEYTLEGLTFGGDSFKIDYDIKLFIDNNEVLSGNEYDLGILFVDDFKRNVVIYNNEDFDLSTLNVSIVAYSEYYHGEEVVQISFYDGNDEFSKNYEYSDSLLIGKLEAHSGIELVMKLSDVPKREFYSVSNKYRFKLIIE